MNWDPETSIFAGRNLFKGAVFLVFAALVWGAWLVSWNDTMFILAVVLTYQSAQIVLMKALFRIMDDVYYQVFHGKTRIELKRERKRMVAESEYD